MIDELRLVADGDLSYVAHEYLAPDNHAYWRSELQALLGAHGLAFVADADFDQPWARMDDRFVGWLRDEGIVGRSLEDTTDLLLYRQLCSPIFTQAPLDRREPEVDELARLHVASRLARLGDPEDGTLPLSFEHPTGVEVEVSDADVRDALLQLSPCWPHGRRVGEAFPRMAAVQADLLLLQRNGLVELRLREPDPAGEPAEALHRLEAPRGYRTTPLHVRELLVPLQTGDG
jgi:hypothetical protein